MGGVGLGTKPFPRRVGSMEILADMFQLDLPTVHSIISKMIINEELMVSGGPRACAQCWGAGTRYRGLPGFAESLCPLLEGGGGAGEGLGG